MPDLAPILAPILVAAGFLLMVLPADSGATGLEVAAGFAQAAVLLGLAFVLVRFVLGSNPAAYVLGAAWLAVGTCAAPLIAQPGRFYAFQGWGLLVLAGALSAWWLLRRPAGAPEGAGS